MNRTRTPRWIALVLLAIPGLIAMKAGAQQPMQKQIEPGAQPAIQEQMGGEFFGFGDYTGGTLHTVFEMERGAGVPIRTYATDITPEESQYHMTETITGLVDITNVQTALGRRGAAAVAGGRFAYRQTPQIDLSPLGVLAEYGVVIEPNQAYYLPGGASLITGDIESIAGIEAIKGIYTHPEYPTQRAVLGTPVDPSVAALLQYPIYFRVELEGTASMFVQLIEFSYTPEETQ